MAKRIELLLSFVFPAFISSTLFWAGIPASSLLKYTTLLTGCLCLLAIGYLVIAKLSRSIQSTSHK